MRVRRGRWRSVANRRRLIGEYIGADAIARPHLFNGGKHQGIVPALRTHEKSIRL